MEPTSSKDAKQAPVWKPKGQVLSEYKVSLRTFEELCGRGLLKGDLAAKQGKVFLELTSHNDFVLRCAANDIHSFKFAQSDVPVLPYHRFLCLRFVNTSFQETYDELVGIGIINKFGAIKKSTLSRYHAQFVRKCPVELREYIDSKTEPIKKEPLRRFRLMLEVLGIQGYYDTPQCVEEMSFFIDHKEHLEPVLTTISTAEEVAEVFGKMANLTIPANLLGSYRTLFYAVHTMQPHDRSVYFASLPPKERHLRINAADMRIQEFVLKQGLDNIYEQRVLLDELQKMARLSLARTSRLKHDAGLQITRANLDIFLKINDRLDLVSKAGKKDVAKLFDRFILKHQDNGPIESPDKLDLAVPVIKEQEKPESS